MLCISFVQKLGIVVGPTEPCCAVLTCGPVDRLLAYQSRGRLPMVPTTAFSNSNGPKQDYRSTRSRLAVVSAGCGPSSTRDVTRWWGHRPERAKQLQQQRHQGSVAVGVGPTAPSRTNKGRLLPRRALVYGLSPSTGPRLDSHCCGGKGIR